MAKFLTPLQVKYQSDDSWVLLSDFVYQSDIVQDPIIVPAGFETDFASVPRVPLAYLLCGDVAHEAAVIHDYLYRTGKSPKSFADDVFLEAMGVQGIAAWRRWPMYLAVCWFGGRAYKGKDV